MNLPHPPLRRRLLTGVLSLATLALALPATAATYFQTTSHNGSGDWNVLAHWNTASNGSGASPTAITNADDFIGNASGRILRTPTGASSFGGQSLTLGPATHVLEVRSSTSTATVPNLVTLGAAKVRSGNTHSTLAVTTWLNQSGTTDIINHTHASALFPLTIGTLTGSGNFHLTGSATGLLRLGVTHAIDYTGTVTLASGRLEFMNPVSSGGTLVVVNPGDVILDHAVSFAGLVVNGTVYSPGTYTASHLGFAGSGGVTVGHSQTWYLTTKQSGTQNWTEAFLSNWNSLANGSGVAPTSISSNDDFVSQTSGGELRTLNAASTFGGGSLTLANTSKLTLRTPANAVSTIPAFITAGTPTITNGIGTIRQNLALGDWEIPTGTTRLSATAGRSLGFDIGQLTGSGSLQTQDGGAFFLSLHNGSGYTGNLNHASGSLRFESPFATRGAFTVGSTASVHLDQPAYFTSFSVAGSAQAAGIHNYTTLNAAHPARFPSGSTSGLVGVYAPDSAGPAHMFGVNLSGPETRNPANFPGTHGNQWSYPSAAAFDYYRDNGLNLVRIPFRWERMQTTLGSGVLNAAELARMDTAIAHAAARGMKVVLVMHNQARWVPGSNHAGHLIGTGPVTLAHFAEAWRLLADHYKGNTALYGYGLMDAPHDTNGTWPAIAQTAVNAIRTVDLGTYVIVAGDNHGNAHGWAANNPALDIKDPVGRLIYEARCFFDANHSGTYANGYDAEGASATVGVNRVAGFVAWLQARNAKGLIGAYGVPANDTRWLTALGNFLSYLQANGVSGTYWAGGPGSVNSPLSVEPTSNYTVHKPQMSVIGNGSTPPPPPPPPPAFLFYDNFESGNLSSGNQHFSWQGFNRTSVITVAPQPAVLAGFQLGQNMSGRDWNVVSGNNALRATYPTEWSQQRFSIKQGLNEVWFQFDLRVPTNFTHQSQGAGIPSNNKIFYVWMDDYSIHGNGSTVGWEYWQGGGGVSQLAMNIRSQAAGAHTGHIQHFNFINPATDRGRWMTLRFYMKVGSGANTADGIVSMWRRWHGEAEFTRHHHKTDVILGNIHGGFQDGYVMGWHNSLYTVEQDWLIDNFIMSAVQP